MVTEEAYAALQAENATLREELATALQRIRELEAKKTPPPSFVKANTPALSKRERKQRAPEANQARQREEPSVVVREALPMCPDCGGRLGGVHVGRRRQVVDLPPPAAVVVTEYQLEKGWCSACQQWREARVDLTGQTLGQGRLGIGVAALVAHLRMSLRLPLRRIQTYLADLHGLHISVGEVVDLLRRVGERGIPTLIQIRDTARRRAVVHADETSWREAGQNGYAWLLATPEGERYVEYHHSRAGAVANALLGEDFGGVLVSDFYGGYNDTPGGRHQRCWVHLLRDVQALGEAHAADLSVAGLEARAWVAAVKALWRQVRRALQHPPHTPVQQQQRALLVTHLFADLQALGAQFVQVLDHPCRALAWRLWHFQHELLTCLAQSGVPPDNNLAERAARPLVVMRKISGGTRSPQGSTTQMRLYSLAATWTAQGHNPLTRFRQLLSDPLPQV
ncbi:MAG TPA: IS66 family transposase [Ktedonobacterales bacterium]|nr:IS66 family transposase [Ktedonobacterales bacterium]